MNVRLSNQQIEGITKAIKPFLGNKPAKLYLYGSRTDLNKKGGDIDLLLVLARAEQTSLMKIKHKLLARIKSQIGEQKIDLFLATPEMLKTDEFLQLVLPTAVLLKQF